jgi:hypothetical protein
MRLPSHGHGARPPYGNLHDLFIEGGLVIKNSSDTPAISSVGRFIEPRERVVNSGELTSFQETELAEITEVF